MPKFDNSGDSTKDAEGVLDSIEQSVPSKLKTTFSAFKQLYKHKGKALFATYAIYQYLKYNGYGLKKSVSGEHAYITGAGSGIGRLLALKLAKLGCNITAVDIDKAAADNTVKQITLQGGNAIALKVDVTDADQIHQSAIGAVSAFGDVTILINNAGIVEGKNIFEVNIKSMTYTVKEFMPTMLSNNKGHIVTMASMSGFIGAPKMAEYSATKAAAIAYDE